MVINLVFVLAIVAAKPQGVREVAATSCDVVTINVGLGMVTQLVFESTPTQTLFASEQYYKVVSAPDAPRSVAVISLISQEVMAQTMTQEGISSIGEAMKRLDRTYTTNLFVFFRNQNQMQFQLRLVPKESADRIVQIRQVFRKDCRL